MTTPALTIDTESSPLVPLSRRDDPLAPGSAPSTTKGPRPTVSPETDFKTQTPASDFDATKSLSVDLSAIEAHAKYVLDTLTADIHKEIRARSLEADLAIAGLRKMIAEAGEEAEQENANTRAMYADELERLKAEHAAEVLALTQEKEKIAARATLSRTSSLRKRGVSFVPPVPITAARTVAPDNDDPHKADSILNLHRRLDTMQREARAVREENELLKRRGSGGVAGDKGVQQRVAGLTATVAELTARNTNLEDEVHRLREQQKSTPEVANSVLRDLTAMLPSCAGIEETMATLDTLQAEVEAKNEGIEEEQMKLVRNLASLSSLSSSSGSNARDRERLQEEGRAVVARLNALLADRDASLEKMLQVNSKVESVTHSLKSVCADVSTICDDDEIVRVAMDLVRDYEALLDVSTKMSRSLKVVDDDRVRQALQGPNGTIDIEKVASMRSDLLLEKEERSRVCQRTRAMRRNVRRSFAHVAPLVEDAIEVVEDVVKLHEEEEEEAEMMKRHQQQFASEVPPESFTLRRNSSLKAQFVETTRNGDVGSISIDAGSTCESDSVCSNDKKNKEEEGVKRKGDDGAALRVKVLDAQLQWWRQNSELEALQREDRGLTRKVSDVRHDVDTLQTLSERLQAAKSTYTTAATIEAELGKCVATLHSRHAVDDVQGLRDKIAATQDADLDTATCSLSQTIETHADVVAATLGSLRALVPLYEAEVTTLREMMGTKEHQGAVEQQQNQQQQQQHSPRGRSPSSSPRFRDGRVSLIRRRVECHDAAMNTVESLAPGDASPATLIPGLQHQVEEEKSKVRILQKWLVREQQQGKASSSSTPASPVTVQVSIPSTPASSRHNAATTPKTPATATTTPKASLATGSAGMSSIDEKIAGYLRAGVAVPPNFERISAPTTASGSAPFGFSTAKGAVRSPLGRSSSSSSSAAASQSYYFGTRRIEVVEVDHSLAVIVGGGYLMFDEFCARYGDSETRRLVVKGDKVVATTAAAAPSPTGKPMRKTLSASSIPRLTSPKRSSHRLSADRIGSVDESAAPPPLSPVAGLRVSVKELGSPTQPPLSPVATAILRKTSMGHLA